MIILGELFKLYTSKKKNKTLTLTAVPYYSDYVAQNQKTVKAEGTEGYNILSILNHSQVI